MPASCCKGVVKIPRFERHLGRRFKAVEGRAVGESIRLLR
jgi:hypothetical protein